MIDPTYLKTNLSLSLSWCSDYIYDAWGIGRVFYSIRVA